MSGKVRLKRGRITTGTASGGEFDYAKIVNGIEELSIVARQDGRIKIGWTCEENGEHHEMSWDAEDSEKLLEELSAFLYREEMSRWVEAQKA